MRLNDILKYILYGALFITPAIALIVTPSLFFPYIAGKNFVFRVLVELMLCVWALLALRDASYRPKFSWFLPALLSFLVILAVADFGSPNPFKSFWSNFERMEGLITHLHLFVYFVIAGTILSSEKLWERFFATSVGISVIVASHALLQFWGVITIQQGGVRVDATFGNATYLAIYLLFHIFLILWILRRHTESLGLKIAGSVIIALHIFIIYHTATRGAILGLIGGLLLTGLLIALFERNRPTLRKLAIGTVVAVLVIVGGFFVIKDSNFVKNSPVLNRFATISLEQSTTKARFLIWSMSIEGFKEKPIFGWGQESFNYVFNAHYNPQMYNQEQWFDRTHNVIFDWLIAGGILGLLAYLSFFAIALWYLWKPGNTMSFVERSIFTGLLAGYFFHNLFVFDNITSYTLFFAVIAYIHFHNARPFKSALINEKRVEEGTYRVMIPVVVALSALLMWSVNAKPLIAGGSLIESFKPQPGGIEENYQLIDRALTTGSFATSEVREQLAQMSAQIHTLPAQTASDELKQKFLDRAESELKLQIAATPEDARYQLFLGSFLGNDFMGEQKTRESLTYLKKALELSPGKQSILFEIGYAHISLKEYQEAFQIFKQAYEEAPQFDTARRNYAMAAAYLGNQALVNELLSSAYGTSYIADDRFIRAYYDTRQFANLVKVWEAKVAADPNNPQTRLSLAAAYIEVAQPQEAIKQLQEAIRLNPDFKIQGEYYIKEIQAGRRP